MYVLDEGDVGIMLIYLFTLDRYDYNRNEDIGESLYSNMTFETGKHSSSRPYPYSTLSYLENSRYIYNL